MEHIKPRLLGHWGTSPGLSMIYVLLNRLINRTGSDWLYVTGPGHGGPSLVAAAYLEGTYSEVYPHITSDAAGVLTLFRQFSSPGGSPATSASRHPAASTRAASSGMRWRTPVGRPWTTRTSSSPASSGTARRRPGLLSGSWKLPYFLNPRRDGAVLPILHLNGYKIAGPTVFGRTSDEDAVAYLAQPGLGPGRRRGE